MTAIVKWNLCLDLASIPQFQIIFHFPDLIADPFLKTKSPDSNSQKKLPPNTSSFSDLTATPLAGWLGGAQEAKVFGARSKRSDIKTSKMLKSEKPGVDLPGWKGERWDLHLHRSQQAGSLRTKGDPARC